MDEGADGASLIRGRGDFVVCRIGSGRRDGVLDPEQGLIATEGRAIEMHVPEAHRKLERQREQRQARPQPRM